MRGVLMVRAVFGAVIFSVTMATTVTKEAAADDAVATPAVSTFGISLSIAKDETGARVVDDDWVNAQIADANRLFQPHGTSFRWVIEKELHDAHASMHSRDDRNALTPLTERSGFIDVFVVRELEDVDDPGRLRMGVCWTNAGKKDTGKRFIIIARSARPTVLAHELGHFFGNREHSNVINNLMSYSREVGASVFLDDKQVANIKSFTRMFLDTGRLKELSSARHLP